MKKLVWLNLNTGEFSESWKEEDYSSIDTMLILEKYSPKDGWKLIKYECLNDEDFEFNNLMIIK
jgi:hypothetical protein